MCFAKTFQVFHDIEEKIFNAVPFEQYCRGCILIAWIGSKLLRDLGYQAKPMLVGALRLRKRKKVEVTLIPHYVIDCEGDLIDFKRRCFDDGRSSVPPCIHHDGFYPYRKNFSDGLKETYYYKKPRCRDFRDPIERKKFIEFREMLNDDVPTGWEDIYASMI